MHDETILTFHCLEETDAVVNYGLEYKVTVNNKLIPFCSEKMNLIKHC